MTDDRPIAEVYPRLIHDQAAEQTTLALKEPGHPFDHRLYRVSDDTFLMFDDYDRLVGVQTINAHRPDPQRVPFPVEWR